MDLPHVHKKRWPMICGCSVIMNKPTRQIGKPPPSSRSQNSASTASEVGAARAPSISQSAMACVSFMLGAQLRYVILGKVRSRGNQ